MTECRLQRAFELFSHCSQRCHRNSQVSWLSLLIRLTNNCPLFLYTSSFNMCSSAIDLICDHHITSHHIPLDTEDATLNDERLFQKQLTYCLQRSTLLNSLPFCFFSLMAPLGVFQGRKSISVKKHLNKFPSTATQPLNSRPIQM